MSLHDEVRTAAAWLLNNVGLRWKTVAEWSRSEPLMRRALAIDEQAYGPDHPDVAASLNSLARLLRSTNRLAEAEPLMRLSVEILLAFTVATGHEHPHLQTHIGNDEGQLLAMGRSEVDVRGDLNARLRHYGLPPTAPDRGG